MLFCSTSSVCFPPANQNLGWCFRSLLVSQLLLFHAWATQRSAQEFINRVCTLFSGTPSPLNSSPSSISGEEGIYITSSLHSCKERLGAGHSLCRYREEIPLYCSLNPDTPGQSSFSSTFKVFCQLFQKIWFYGSLLFCCCCCFWDKYGGMYFYCI